MENPRPLALEKVFNTAVIGTQHIKDNGVIFESGRAADNIFYLHEGTVLLRRNARIGQISDIAQRGDIFGTEALNLNERYKFAAEAHGAVEVSSISSRKIQQILREVPESALPILTAINTINMRLMDKVTLFTGDSRLRILSTLLEFDDGERVHAMQQDIADRAYANRVTVAKVLRTLKNDGIINSHQGNIQILDYQRISDIIDGERFSTNSSRTR